MTHEEIRNNLIDRYFVEYKNPLTKIALRFLGRPVTKEDMKKELSKSSKKEKGERQW